MPQNMNRAPRDSQDDLETEDVAPAPTEEQEAKKAALNDDIDGVLADIDKVLEPNAQEWVNAYVQKGGE